MTTKEGANCGEGSQKTKENVNVELGGIGFYGTTGNVEVEGYSMSGDIEKAAQLDTGFKKKKELMGAKASLPTV